MINLKISVIIPVYKVERYIERCVRSLMEQTMKEEIEFIFINDCTPDKSMDVLECTLTKYQNRKDQVRIIQHSENKGIAFTRGEGIKEAKGEYIGWCDSDDWCEPDMFEKMYAATKSGTIDVVVCDYINELPNKSQKTDFALVSNTPESLACCSNNRSFSPYLWHQVIKRSFLEKASKFFLATSVGEDRFLLAYCYYHAQKMFVVKQPLYHYNQLNVSSVTRTDKKTYREWLAQKTNIEILEKILCNTPSNMDQFSRTINWLKFFRKTGYMQVFNDPKEYFYSFKECHEDIMKFTDIPKKARLSLKLIYSNYLVFRLYCFFRGISFPAKIK